MTLWQVRTRVRDLPGTLARLATALGSVPGNVVGIDVQGCDTTHVHDDLFVDVPDSVTQAELGGALAAAVEGTEPVYARRARAQELVDGPSHALALAERLVEDPASMPKLVCQLVGGDSVEPRYRIPAESDHELVVIVPPTGEVMVIRRDWAPFTVVERARVDRFLACAASIARARSRAGHSATLADGAEVRLRDGTPADTDDVADLLERCSESTRQGRFMSPTVHLSDEWLARLASPAGGFAVLAYSETGALIGMAQCLPDTDQDVRGDVAPGPAGSDRPGRHEIGLVVVDTWQRRGVGTLLLRSLVRRARSEGIEDVVSVGIAGRPGAERLFVRAGLAPVVRYVDGIREVRARLRSGRRAAGSDRRAAGSDRRAAGRMATVPEPISPTHDQRGSVLSGRRARQAWARSQA
ncbi:GNAT family N-acetyltransferase [Actinopolymorpha sp. B17G11]|uniref:GNAT family N-acetyltransferase n=1 Tax=unclassified Actinopolymorpha TaxID=2627063 RepID=UPI0032D8EA7C